MKKTVRTLGLSLLALTIFSCSSDNGGSEPTTTVTESNLAGTYIYTSVNVQNAVDLDGDGVFNNDLIRENYKSCTLDNQIVITDKTYSFIMKGTQCSSSETDLIFTYKLNKDEKTIALYLDGQKAGDIDGIEFFDFNGSKTYQYRVYDDNLGQNVIYGMTAIK